jgi:hypothetical protein
MLFSNPMETTYMGWQAAFSRQIIQANAPIHVNALGRRSPTMEHIMNLL